jgi:hypothetical protein
MHRPLPRRARMAPSETMHVDGGRVNASSRRALRHPGPLHDPPRDLATGTVVFGTCSWLELLQTGHTVVQGVQGDRVGMHRSLQPWEIEQLQSELAALPIISIAPELGSPDRAAAELQDPPTLFSTRNSHPDERAATGMEVHVDLVLAELRDPSEIRCTVFRSRALQRQQQQSWIEKAFVGWDWAFSARKTRRRVTTRCSQQRNRRTTASTLVEWRTAASKVKRRRRLGVIFATRSVDSTTQSVLAGWQHLVTLRRKCAKLIHKFQDHKGTSLV